MVSRQALWMVKPLAAARAQGGEVGLQIGDDVHAGEAAVQADHGQQGVIVVDGGGGPGGREREFLGVIGAAANGGDGGRQGVGVFPGDAGQGGGGLPVLVQKAFQDGLVQAVLLDDQAGDTLRVQAEVAGDGPLVQQGVGLLHRGGPGEEKQAALPLGGNGVQSAGKGGIRLISLVGHHGGGDGGEGIGAVQTGKGEEEQGGQQEGEHPGPEQGVPGAHRNPQAVDILVPEHVISAFLSPAVPCR